MWEVKSNKMDKRLIFIILVAVVGVTLLVSKIITLENITDNLTTIGVALLGVFAWLTENKQKETLKKELESLKKEKDGM